MTGGTVKLNIVLPSATWTALQRVAAEEHTTPELLGQIWLDLFLQQVHRAGLPPVQRIPTVSPRFDTRKTWRVEAQLRERLNDLADRSQALGGERLTVLRLCRYAVEDRLHRLGKM